MEGIIGLEKYFSFNDTIEDSNDFLDHNIWPELKSLLLNFDGKRLAFMDEFGMEMMKIKISDTVKILK